MRFIKLFLVASSLTLGMGASVLAAPTELAGIKIEDHSMVGNVDVPLNGAGIRVKFFKIYVGELYATKKVHTLEELNAAPGPKRVKLTFLRDIDATQFGKLLTKGVQDNVPKEQLSKMVPGLIRMGEIFAANKSFVHGDWTTTDWIPGTGMVITVKGKVQGEPFKDVEFFNGLMSVWFGQNPGDWKLKDAMLDVK